MARSDLSFLARAAGAAALASLLLYGGMALERAQPPAAEAILYVVATLAGAIAAVWALAHVNHSPVARWVALGLVGLLPIASFVGWLLRGDAGGPLLAVLWLNLLSGLAALAVIGWRMSIARTSGRGRGRVARVG